MAEKFTKNEFWKKKFMKECEVRDTNKDGFLSRSDLDLVFQRYKDMGTSEKHLAKLKGCLADISEALGIADPSTKLTYEEVTANLAKESDKFKDLAKIFPVCFEVIDSNGNGVISFKEWCDYYKVIGIDTAHARPCFDAMDTNGDGVVSMEEFIAFNKEYFFSVEDKLKSSIMYGPLD